MATLEQLIATGRIVDLMFAFFAIEIVALWLWRRRSGAGPSVASLLINIGAGASLMLALRFALTGGGWQPIAACLIGALVFHLADVASRWHAAGDVPRHRA